MFTIFVMYKTKKLSLFIATKQTFNARNVIAFMHHEDIFVFINRIINFSSKKQIFLSKYLSTTYPATLSTKKCPAFSNKHIR